MPCLKSEKSPFISRFAKLNELERFSAKVLISIVEILSKTSYMFSVMFFICF